MSLPLRTIPRAQPGESALFQVSKILSTFAELALSAASSARAEGTRQARVTKPSRLHRLHFIGTSHLANLDGLTTRLSCRGRLQERQAAQNRNGGPGQLER